MAYKEKDTWKNIPPSSSMKLADAKKNLGEWAQRNQISKANLKDFIKREDLSLGEAKSLLKAMKRDSKTKGK